MDLKELKNTWNKLDNSKQLNEEQIKAMLEKRTSNLLDRIDQNIRVGFILLFLLILVFMFDDFILSPNLIESVNGDVTVPRWIVFLGNFSNTLIFTTFIYFVIKYYRVKKNCRLYCDLKQTLIEIIDTLKIYKRLFYLALVAMLFSMATGLLTGIYKGIEKNAETQGVLFTEIPPDKIFFVAVIGVLALFIIIGGIFLFLRWGFYKLYGNYINKLKLNLQELLEINE